MSFIHYIMQTIPFMMLVFIALGEVNMHLLMKIGSLVTGKVKTKPGQYRKRVIIQEETCKH